MPVQIGDVKDLGEVYLCMRYIEGLAKVIYPFEFFFDHFLFAQIRESIGLIECWNWICITSIPSISKHL